MRIPNFGSGWHRVLNKWFCTCQCRRILFYSRRFCPIVGHLQANMIFPCAVRSCPSQFYVGSENCPSTTQTSNTNWKFNALLLLIYLQMLAVCLQTFLKTFFFPLIAVHGGHSSATLATFATGEGVGIWNVEGWVFLVEKQMRWRV